MNHFFTKALRGDRGGVMNLTLTVALLGRWRSDESLLYIVGFQAIFRLQGRKGVLRARGDAMNRVFTSYGFWYLFRYSIGVRPVIFLKMVRKAFVSV
jgi:hypothetical protein